MPVSPSCRTVLPPARRLAPAFLLLALAGAGLGGCASSGRLDDANRTIAALTDENARYRQRISELESADAMRGSTVESRDALIGKLRQDLANSNADRLRLEDQMRQLDDRLRNMGNFGPIDAVTDQQLRQLAAQYPDLFTYDADRGMIQLKSDVTFDSGSDVLKDRAKTSLNSLASVLQGGAASQYDVRIVGHTDSQPIGKSRDRFPTNMHLSAYRAISVFNQLKSAGVAATRMEIAGRGEYLPAVQNTPSGNTPENRRVELYLVKAPPRPAPPPAKQAPTSAPARPQDEIDMK